MLDLQISGSKGGGEKPHTPVEAPNNLLSVAYAKVLLAVAEGELAGQPTARDIFLDGTPLMNEDGSSNFGGVTWEWRSGTQHQEYIKGLPEVSTEYNVGTEVLATSPWVQSVTKNNLDAVRVTFTWPALMQQKSNGDTTGATVDYAIDIATDGGSFVEYQKYQVTGKTNSPYERTHRVDLPDSTGGGWTIRVRRLTPDSTSSTLANKMSVKSYTEVIDVRQTYPHTALLYVEFDSRTFGAGSIPQISVKTRGRLIQVPDTYNPETRQYVGVWSGAFKWAWTDNPAWVFYDLVTQNRFGLGHKIDPSMVDKWSLYEVSQYCDVMVPKGDGSGNLEPRHTCNVFIQEQNDAWQVLRDIASTFNGMTYWSGTEFKVIADKEEDLTGIPVFSRANVVNGRFDYPATDDRSIYTSALISYDDPDNQFNTAVEATWEKSQMQRFGGDRQTSISAIGCTSRGEAQRRGKYSLLTNIFNRQVSFQTGLQGLSEAVLPGQLIHVVDPLLGGKPFTGRIKVATPRVITLDRNTEAKAGDVLYLTKKNGDSEGRTVQSSTGNIVTVTTSYSELIEPNAVWYLEAADLKSQLFRVTKVTSPSESVYEIEGVEYNESKYGAIDNGARLESRPINKVPSRVQEPPASVAITSRTYVEQTMAVSTMTISWPQTPNATSYEVQWKVSEGDWVNVGVTGATEIDIKGIYSGQYIARVRARNARDIASVWTTSMLTDLKGKEGAPPTLASLTTRPLIYGIGIDWSFKPGSSDTHLTEIAYSTTTSFDDSKKLGDFAYPQDTHELHNLKLNTTLFFWARLIDKTGNIGDWFPKSDQIGVVGQVSSDPSEYDEYFKGQIGESALDQEMRDKIDKIDTLEGLDKYDPNESYLKYEMVIVDGIIYSAKQDVPADPSGANSPPNDTYWTNVGESVETNEGLAQQVEQNRVDIIEIDGELTSVASNITALKAASRKDGEGDLLGALNQWTAIANYVKEINVRTTETSALAEATETLQAEVGETNAAVQEVSRATADLNGKAEAMWAVKLNVNSNGQYVAAGIGVGIENGPAGLQSSFIVQADRFAVVNGTGSIESIPFIVDSGNVFIQSALIKDGTITNAKIGEYISSTNYIPNSTGWRLDKTGTIEINGSVAGQGRLQINNTSVKVYHPNGQLAIDLGINI